MGNKKKQITLIVVFAILAALSIGLFIGVCVRGKGAKGLTTLSIYQMAVVNDMEMQKNVPVEGFSVEVSTPVKAVEVEDIIGNVDLEQMVDKVYDEVKK